jgi:hypothetical protein
MHYLGAFHSHRIDSYVLLSSSSIIALFSGAVEGSARAQSATRCLIYTAYLELVVLSSTTASLHAVQLHGLLAQRVFHISISCSSTVRYE